MLESSGTIDNSLQFNRFFPRCIDTQKYYLEDNRLVCGNVLDPQHHRAHALHECHKGHPEAVPYVQHEALREF